MSKDLGTLRTKWEGSSASVATTVTDHTVISVNKVGNWYWVYRYFMLAGSWAASVDLAYGTADEAFNAYANAVKLAL
jgi:hypothetical protein